MTGALIIAELAAPSGARAAARGEYRQHGPPTISLGAVTAAAYA
jgi:hypothetical protein